MSLYKRDKKAKIEVKMERGGQKRKQVGRGIKRQGEAEDGGCVEERLGRRGCTEVEIRQSRARKPNCGKQEGKMEEQRNKEEDYNAKKEKLIITEIHLEMLHTLVIRQSRG